MGRCAREAYLPWNAPIKYDSLPILGDPTGNRGGLRSTSHTTPVWGPPLGALVICSVLAVLGESDTAGRDGCHRALPGQALDLGWLTGERLANVDDRDVVGTKVVTTMRAFHPA